MKNESFHQRKIVLLLTDLKSDGKIIEFFAIPNGGYRNSIEMKSLLAEGLTPGASDLCIITQNKVWFIELKVPPQKLKSGKLSYHKSKPSDKQKDFLKTIQKSNVCDGVVIYGYEQFKEFLKYCLL